MFVSLRPYLVSACCLLAACPIPSTSELVGPEARQAGSDGGSSLVDAGPADTRVGTDAEATRDADAPVELDGHTLEVDAQDAPVVDGAALDGAARDAEAGAPASDDACDPQGSYAQDFDQLAANASVSTLFCSFDPSTEAPSGLALEDGGAGRALVSRLPANAAFTSNRGCVLLWQQKAAAAPLAGFPKHVHVEFDARLELGLTRLPEGTPVLFEWFKLEHEGAVGVDDIPPGAALRWDTYGGFIHSTRPVSVPDSGSFTELRITALRDDPGGRTFHMRLDVTYDNAYWASAVVQVDDAAPQMGGGDLSPAGTERLVACFGALGEPGETGPASAAHYDNLVVTYDGTF